MRLPKKKGKTVEKTKAQQTKIQIAPIHNSWGTEVPCKT